MTTNKIRSLRQLLHYRIKGGGGRGVKLFGFRGNVLKNRLQTKECLKKIWRQNNYYATIIVQGDYLLSFKCFFFPFVLGIEDAVTPLVSLAGKRHEL